MEIGTVLITCLYLIHLQLFPHRSTSNYFQNSNPKSWSKWKQECILTLFIFFPQCKKKNIFEKQRFGICHTAAWNDTPHNSPDHKISQQTRPCLSKKSKWTKTRIFTLYCYYNTKFKKKNIFEKQFLGIYHTCTVWNDTPHNLSCLNFSKKRNETIPVLLSLHDWAPSTHILST